MPATTRLVAVAVASLAPLSVAPLVQAAPSAPAAPASKLSPKDNAQAVLRNALKSMDFNTRALAFKALALDKGNKDARKLLEDGMSDPQWVVRRGVAEAMYALGDARWKQLVHDALAQPTLSPYDVLPALDDLAQKDAFAIVLDTLADKEHNQQDMIWKGLVGRNRPDLGDLLKAALAHKDALVLQSAVKAVPQLDAVLHGKPLEVVAKAQAANDEVVKGLIEVAAAADSHVATPWLAAVKPKDGKLQQRVLILRAQHGDRTVGKALLGAVAAVGDKEKIELLLTYKLVMDKGDVGTLKTMLNGATPEVTFQLYELLARLGDRELAKQAQQLADSTDVDVRAAGVFYLGWVGGPGRIGEMHQYLRDGIPAVRKAAARIIGHIGSPVSVGPLKDAHDAENDDRVRMELVKAMAGIRDKEGFVALLGFTKERDAEVRRVVVKALADSGDPEARQGLNNAINDNEPRIRFEAVRGFLLSDPAKAVAMWKRAIKWLPRGALLELTRELNTTMESFLELAVFESAKDERGMATREEALLALHLLPSAELKVLHKIMETTEDQELKVRILGQLFQMEGKKVATEIKSAALGQAVRARVSAIRMLGKLKGDKEATEILTKLIDDVDERVRAAASLTFLGG
jgi:HEAT repeat protein